MTDSSARLVVRRGAFCLDVAVPLPSSGVSVLFGPSASGKTTLLGCLAGLVRAELGKIVVQGEAWQDTERGVFVPTHRRRVGVVFQTAALFPHLTVQGNLDYGLRRAKAGDLRFGFERVVEALGVGSLLARSPATLSGGERQRVAIARALLGNPRLLLMDEPLASLDGASRAEILNELWTVPREFGVPIVYVTHQIDEAARLGDRLLWLDRGSLKAEGPVSELLGRLDLGVRLGDDAGGIIAATIVEHDERYHLTRLDSAWGPVFTHRLAPEPGAEVRLRVRARDVSLGLGVDERSSILNVFEARVAAIADAAPGEVLVRVECPNAPGETLLALITRKSCDELALSPGMAISARVKGVSVR